MKTFFLTLLLISSSAFAKSWTSTKSLKIDFSQTDINPSEVKVTFEYFCNYKYKFIDIFEGRVSEGTKSCGDFKKELTIIDGVLTLPEISQFNHRKADLLERYGMQVKLDWKGRNLIWISAGQNSIIEFYSKPFDLRFEKFELKNLEVKLDGINIIENPEFKGKNTEVTTYFYAKKDLEDFKYIIDTDFTRSFKWYLNPFTTINQNDSENLGKISIKPHYHAFINGKDSDVTLDVYAKNKLDQFVVAEKIVISLTQAAIDQLKSVELKRN